MKKSISGILVFLIFIVQQQIIAMPGGRKPVRAHNGMVVSSSKYASKIGADVLKSGGNAIDAAVATAFALAVTWLAAGNIGGGGFLVYHGVDGKITAFDFREKAPLAASERMFLDADGEIYKRSNHDGVLAIGVPGTVAGLALAHEKLGRLKWKDLVKPAYKMAKDGIEMTWALYDGFKYYQKEWHKHPGSAKKFLKSDGRLYQPGEKFRQRDLAATLKRIMKKGRDGFYRGKTADLLVDFMQRNGGLITQEDLEKYQAIERKPVHGQFRGFDIYGMCPPSSGGVAIVEMLNILSGYELKTIGHNSAAYLHLLTEAMRRAFADRARFLGDPDFNADMPLEKLLSLEYAAQLRKGIALDTTSVSDSVQFNDVYESEETTHFSVVDRAGNMVSMTYTLEASFGSKMVVDGAGFLLNNEMGDFNPMPGYTDSRGYIGTPPNLVRPQRRMLSSMSPVVVAQNGRPVMAIGSPGGRTIINTVLQVLLNVIEFDMNIAKAIESPRIHHQWLPDKTVMEDWGISPDSQRLYQALGHQIRFRETQGRAMGLFRDAESGLIYGAADSRSPDGAAIGY